MPLGERWQLTMGVQNLLDANYRHHGSGVDMPGANAYVGMRFLW
jgi:outer membrane receptor protein involved in Fe transport